MRFRERFTVVLLLLASLSGFAQESVLGGDATLWIGGNASFFFGSNTTLNGTVTNNGTIGSGGDLDFVLNEQVGSLLFNGTGDQNLSGDTLTVFDMEVNKTDDSKVILLTDRVFVSNMLNVVDGVIQADDELDLIVTGSSDDTGAGYVEGKLVGLSDGSPVSFPMGVGGAPNYISLETINLTGGNANVIMRVECLVPDPTTINPDEDIVGISDEVEWLITSLGDTDGDPATLDAQLSIDFSGIDLTSFSNGEFINADAYEPAIVVQVPGDSLFRVLESESITDFTDASTSSTGSILASDLVGITGEPIRIAVAWLPKALENKFFIPNTFAPGGFILDNRTFRPFFSGEEVTSITMTVYNSLNAEVYSVAQSSSNVDLDFIGWNGVLPSGQDAPSGVYYYSIRLVSLTETYNESGSVLLVR